jgi:hypothetical protein
MAISSALGSQALLPAGLGFRNKIINGDMRIAQRGTATITGSGSAQYPVDRWAVYNGTGTVTFVQSTDAPAGFNASILATVTATGSYSTAGYTQITHKIEGFNCQDLAYGTTSAKTVVFSFWVKSSVVGIQNVSFKNSGNNRVYVSKYTVDVANTWEKKTITVVGDTTGTWLVDSGVGLEITFNLGMGTQYDATAGSWQALAARYSTSDAIDFAANSGATFRVTGVQLEQNLQPTPFEQRPYGVELQLCQRYYEKSYPFSMAPGTADYSYLVTMICSAGASTTGEIIGNYYWSVWKRVAPTITWYDHSGNINKITRLQMGVANHGNNTATNGAITERFAAVSSSSGSTAQGVQFHFTAQAEL